MEYINGCTFGCGSPRGFTQQEAWKESLRLMVESTGCDTVILPVVALQDHAYSTKIDYDDPRVISADDVRNVCAEARRLGLKFLLKTMVNCRDGYWRAYIRFFDTYVPTEPTWAEWFASYDEFVLYLAELAQEVQADMFCIGCETVGTDHRAREWRSLIARIRQRYHGPITYNCDKFQENNITWWDAVDAISSSGYYPIDKLDENFARIHKVCLREKKPFFFMESGCPSRRGSEYVPNNWAFGGEQCLQSQADWYAAFTDALRRHPWVRGAVWWDWSAVRLYPIEKARTDAGYAVYGKPAAAVLRDYSRDIALREARKGTNNMLAAEMKTHLENKILPFWMKLADEEHGGFYGYVDKHLVAHPHAHKGCILNSRTLWTFATAARVLDNDIYLAYARRALDFMAKFEDAERGGVYWSVTAEGEPLDKTKHTYCQAFAIYGLAAYMRAVGEQDPLYAAARDKAFGLFRVIEEHCADEGGYGEAFEPDYVPVGNEKLSDNPKLMERGEVAQRTMNTLLHVLEAYAELYRAVPDEDVRKAGEKCLQRFLNVLYNQPERRLEVFFDKDYRSLIDMQSYGHDIEASWLMWDAVEALIPEAQRAPYRDMCLALAESTCERAFTDHGFENEVVEGEVEHTRIWWVQAETMLGFANALELTGDAAWAERMQQQWRYIQDVIVDPRANGEWYWSTGEDGVPTNRPIVEEWKCPYHNGRMCLRLIEKEGK